MDCGWAMPLSHNTIRLDYDRATGRPPVSQTSTQRGYVAVRSGKVPMSTTPTAHDVIIIGSGPAGDTAAIFAARAEFKTAGIGTHFAGAWMAHNFRVIRRMHGASASAGARSAEVITHRATGADGPALTAGQPTADGDGGAEPPCGSRTVINRTISSRSAADGRPMPGWYP